MSDAFTDCAKSEKKEKDNFELHEELMQTDAYYRKMHDELTDVISKVNYYERQADSIRTVLRSIAAKNKRK